MSLLRSVEHFHTLYNIWRHPQAGRSDIIAFQNRKLRSLISHAYANVTHYRELLVRSGVKPDDIQTVDDLQFISPTSKDDLRMRSLGETISSGADPSKLVSLMTSGSSGKPFTIRRSALEEHLINMFRLRALHQVGVRISDRIARVRETPLGVL
jgi:phenylacetate-CoA ligase